MARGWPFIGGVLVVTTITYLNMTTITVIAKDIQKSLVREQKKLEAAAAKKSPQTKDQFTWPSRERVADRVKKIWNQDIERSVKRMQTTDWERMGKAVEERVERARERVATSMARIREDSKKSSPEIGK
jgi:hypothetical protein